MNTYIIPFNLVNLSFHIFLIAYLSFILFITPFAIKDMKQKRDRTIWITIFCLTVFLTIFGLIFI